MGPIPDSILSKPGPLDPQEWVVIKRHPELGQAILSRVDRLRREAEIVIAHHERLDGSGYPDGLAGTGIALEARVLGVANAFVAATDDRTHGRALEHGDAIAMLRSRAGTQFDPDCVAAAIAALEDQHNWDSTLLVRRRVGLASLDADR